MNCAEIEVQSAKFSAGDEIIVCSNIATNAEEETLTLTFSKPLPVGAGQVDLNFTGILNDKLRGFYRSSYTGLLLKY